jgi:hypothetical protein
VVRADRIVPNRGEAAVAPYASLERAGQLRALSEALSLLRDE